MAELYLRIKYKAMVSFSKGFPKVFSLCICLILTASFFLSKSQANFMAPGI